MKTIKSQYDNLCKNHCNIHYIVNFPMVGGWTFTHRFGPHMPGFCLPFLPWPPTSPFGHPCHVWLGAISSCQSLVIHGCSTCVSSPMNTFWPIYLVYLIICEVQVVPPHGSQFTLFSFLVSGWLFVDSHQFNGTKSVFEFPTFTLPIGSGTVE